MKKNVFGLLIRRMLVQISRSRIKTALVAGMALVCLFSLAWMSEVIHNTENEINHLYDTMVVSAEVRQAGVVMNMGLIEAFPAGEFIRARTVSRVIAHPFVSGYYLEANVAGGFILAASEDGGILPPGTFDYMRYHNPYFWERDWLFSVSDLYDFMEDNVRFIQPGAVTLWHGEYVVLCPEEFFTIAYMPGYGSGDFVYVPGEPIPIIVSESTLAVRNVEPGDIVCLYFFPSYPEVHLARIIGVFHGYISRVGLAGAGLAIVPLDAMYTIMGIPHLNFLTLRTYIDPMWNRELETFARDINHILNDAHAGHVPLVLYIDDHELRIAVTGLENSLDLFRILYPVAQGVVFVLAMGFAFMIIALHVKIMAIMRVLGTAKLRTGLVVCVEYLTVTIVGFLIGAVVLMFMGVDMDVVVYSSGLYLAGAVLGAGVGAVFNIRKSVMELLQVKE